MDNLDSHKPYILFADDDFDFLQLLRVNCRVRGFDGHFVSTGIEIIQSVQNQIDNDTQPFDAIVADVNYLNASSVQTSHPITGVRAAIQVRKLFPNIPIVFVTAYSSVIVRNEMNKISNEIMTKPIEIEILFDRIAFLAHWYRRISSLNLKVERRVRSINRSGFYRRATDVSVENLSIPASFVV